MRLSSTSIIEEWRVKTGMFSEDDLDYEGFTKQLCVDREPFVSQLLKFIPLLTTLYDITGRVAVNKGLLNSVDAAQASSIRNKIISYICRLGDCNKSLVDYYYGFSSLFGFKSKSEEYKNPMYVQARCLYFFLKSIEKDQIKYDLDNIIFKSLRREALPYYSLQIVLLSNVWESWFELAGAVLSKYSYNTGCGCNRLQKIFIYMLNVACIYDLNQDDFNNAIDSYEIARPRSTKLSNSNRTKVSDLEKNNIPLRMPHRKQLGSIDFHLREKMKLMYPWARHLYSASSYYRDFSDKNKPEGGGDVDSISQDDRDASSDSNVRSENISSSNSNERPGGVNSEVSPKGVAGLSLLGGRAEPTAGKPGEYLDQGKADNKDSKDEKSVQLESDEVKLTCQPHNV